MRRPTNALVTAAAVVGVVAAGCGSSDDSPTATETETVTVSSPATTGASSSGDLQSLIPTPPNTQRTDGPDRVQENGIHMHFQVNGSPGTTMDSYKSDLESKGWSVTVRNAGGGHGGGGATYTGTNSDAYGVFTGGGYGSTTDINACVWPTKPASTNCGDHNNDGD